MLGNAAPSAGPVVLTAAAEEIEAEHAEAVGIERTARAGDLAPPALLRIFSRAHAAIGGNAAERADHRCVLPARRCATRRARSRACPRDRGGISPGISSTPSCATMSVCARRRAPGANQNGTCWVPVCSEAFIGCSAVESQSAHRDSQSTRGEAGLGCVHRPLARRLHNLLICRGP